MPERRMNALHVFVNRAGGISVEDNGEVVAIHTSQVDQVIAWLRECKDEIERGLYEEGSSGEAESDRELEASQK